MAWRAIHPGVGYNARNEVRTLTLRQRLYCISLICVLSGAALWAQGVEATLKGRVTDPSGAAVPGAKVEVKNTGTNQLTPTVTDSAGQYTVPFLQPGAYTLTIEASGFKKMAREGLSLSVGDT